MRESLNPQDFEKTHAVTCVNWGRGEFRRHIALSTSGGQILLYNIDKQTTVKSAKSVTRLQDSHRAVNSLTFSPTNNSIMLSANSDGSVRLWDLRTNRRKAGAVFPKQGDIAREVQCSPFDGTKFAAIYDSGGIQRWDVRNLSTCERRINAHSGAGLSLDWHTEYDYIVSGGLDKQIQVWNMGSDSRKPDHVIPSPSAVAKVRWQFDLQHSNSSSTHGVLNTDIVSCNMSLYNYCIYVWNPRRPYIPRYVIEEHSNVVTDVFWRNNTTLWSTSKDKTFKQHNLANREMAITGLPTQALAWNHENELSFIFQDKHEEHYLQVSDKDLTAVPTDASRRMSSASFKIPSTPVPVNSGSPVTPAICTVAFPGWDANAFIFCAQNYLFDAREPDISFSSNRILDICFHNSLVASHAGKFRLAQTWRILHDIISSEKEAFLKFVPTKQPVHVALQPYTSRITESLKGLSSAELTPSLIPIEDSLPGTAGRSRATSIERSRSRPPDTNRSETGSIRFFSTDTRQELSQAGITSEAPDNPSLSSSESDERDLIASSFDTNSPEVDSTPMENLMSSRGKSQGENKMDDTGKKIFDAKADRNNKTITNRHSLSHLSLQSADESRLDPQTSRISGHNSTLLNPHLVGKSITGKHTSHGEGRLSAVKEISMSARQDRFPSGASSPRSIANHFEAQKEYSSSEESAERLHRNAATKKSSKPSERPSIAGESMAKRYQEYLQTLIHPWRAENMIQQAAQYAMEQGDVQTCATIGLLFMKDYPGAFESEQMIEEWVWAYLLLLRKHELHLTCAEIIKHSPFPAIREMGQVETSLDILCHRCKHPLTDNTAAAREASHIPDNNIAFWYCGHCHILLEGCIFCHIPVKGISITIFECGHKIHQECMAKWIKAIEQIQETMKHKVSEYPLECPSGCQTVLVH